MKYAAIADWAAEKQYSVTFMCVLGHAHLSTTQRYLNPVPSNCQYLWMKIV